MQLLFEIGTEELPPASVMPGLEFLACQFGARAAAERLEHGRLERFATPRRLAIRVNDIAPQTPDLQQTKVGPPVRVAYDVQGNPTQAAIGFARSQGAELDDLVRLVTDKGEYVAVKCVQEGRPARDVLPVLLERLVAEIPWPKPMRWGWMGETWGRPVHWMVCLLDGECLPIRFAGIESGSCTFGHRFLDPGPFELEKPADYEHVLQRAFVVADVDARRAEILAQIEAAAQPHQLVRDEGLLDEVTQLVEYPQCAAGHFDERFLALPREVLISELREHQRYFAIEDDQGRLVNRFIIVYNTKVRDPEVVVRGNERVLVARLSDAEFFLARDMQRSLASRVEDLGQIVFLQQLGSMLEKVRRIVALSEDLAPKIYPDVVEVAKRAALLSKADLTTDMVGEFPELQGIMGREYALQVDGEPNEVALAIEEHYQPRGAGDRVPASPAGVIVSLADKMDTIASCYCIGLQPTGTADPYGLRRAALGIIRTSMEHGLVFSLTDLIRAAVQRVGTEQGDPEEVSRSIEDFFKTRLKGLLAAEAKPDVIDAVLVAGIDDIVGAVERVRALAAMRANADFEPLALAFKRVTNILKQTPVEAVDPGLFEQDAERVLYQAYRDTGEAVRQHLRERSFDSAVEALITLKQPVDQFFDEVLVMIDDDAMRRNRLALLRDLRSLFETIADMSRIQVEAN